MNLLVVTKNLTKIDFRWVDLDICDQKKLILKSKDNSKNIINIWKISSMENLEKYEIPGKRSFQVGFGGKYVSQNLS